MSIDSGSISIKVTDWDTLYLGWGIDSQSIESNWTHLTWFVKLVSTGSGRIDSDVKKMLRVKFGDQSVAKLVSINIANNATKTLASGNIRIPHDADGTKTIDINFELDVNITFSGQNIGTVRSETESFELPRIYRLSTISMPSNGYLGREQTITVTRQVSNYTHTITYTCGSLSGTVCTKASDTTIAFTPPLNLATTNTTGQTVKVTYTISTIYGTNSVGTESITVTHKMHSDDFNPTASLSVSDPTGYAQTYDDYVKGLSKFQVSGTFTPKYSASISTYSSTANDATYTGNPFTTDVLKTAGTHTISMTAKDSRGFSTTVSLQIPVIDYEQPSISKLTVHRVNQDGTENNRGEYVKVTFSAAVTALNNKNTANYMLHYKKTSESVYSADVELTSYKNIYAVTNGIAIFPAATDSSYDIEIIVTDNISTTIRATSASTAFTLIHYRADGTGIAFGKISEYANAVDFGLQVRFAGGILTPCLEAETDLNEVKIPGTYTGENVTTYNYANCPVNSGTFTLLVESCGEDGQIRQTYTTCSKYKPEKYARFYYQGEWGGWFWASSDEVVLYEDESGSNGAISLWASASHYRYIEIYYTDNNGKAGGYTKVLNPNGKTVCLHIQEAGTSIYSRQTMYTISGTTMTPDTETASYVRFSGTALSITMNGTNYIKVVRVIGRA